MNVCVTLAVPASRGYLPSPLSTFHGSRVKAKGTASLFMENVMPATSRSRLFLALDLILIEMSTAINGTSSESTSALVETVVNEKKQEEPSPVSKPDHPTSVSSNGLKVTIAGPSQNVNGIERSSKGYPISGLDPLPSTSQAPIPLSAANVNTAAEDTPAPINATIHSSSPVSPPGGRSRCESLPSRLPPPPNSPRDGTRRRTARSDPQTSKEYAVELARTHRSIGMNEDTEPSPFEVKFEFPSNLFPSDKRRNVLAKTS